MADQVYAIIESGVVANVIVVASEITAELFPGAVRVDNLDPVPGIGWGYANAVFTPGLTPADESRPQ
jgi:hypothetical protein